MYQQVTLNLVLQTDTPVSADRGSEGKLSTPALSTTGSKEVAPATR